MDSPTTPTLNPTPNPSPEKEGEQTARSSSPPSFVCRPAGSSADRAGTGTEKGDGGLGLTPSRREAQVALAVFLAVLVGLLAFRGYGNRLGARPTEPVTAARVDLNRADRAELEQVPSIGPRLAGAIDDHRQAKGPFRSVDDLRDVKGIGPATLDKVRPFVRVEAGAVPAVDRDPPIPDRKRPAITSPGPVSPAPAAWPSGVRKLQPGDPPINVNTASPDELQRLPGVGPVMAQNIAVARPFRSVADLDRVKGIGAKTLEKLRPFVTVE